MKNDNFWKSQFLKHDAVPDTGNPPITFTPPKLSSNLSSVGPKADSPMEEPSTSRKHKTLQPVRSTQFTSGLAEPVPLVLSRFPEKSKIQWEQWLLNRKVVLVKR